MKDNLWLRILSEVTVYSSGSIVIVDDYSDSNHYRIPSNSKKKLIRFASNIITKKREKETEKNQQIAGSKPLKESVWECK